MSTGVESTSIEDFGRELGERIAETPEYEAFARAKEAVESDEEAQRRIAEFERLREEFALARQSGQADQEQVEKVREAQRELHDLSVMEEYLDAQNDLQDRLEDINRAISDPLEVDFGGEAGGCCQD